jgi:serine/threonine-protein kinase
MRREADITQRMRHPSVPRVYEYGEAATGDGSLSYVVMERLTGTLLAEHLAKGPLSWQDSARVAANVADVLTVAHERGVVHRDLTPSNIMITKDGAKILDFGAAVEVATRGHRTGTLIAPRADPFAGPGEPADDVYALGVLLYQMLTGRSPYATVHQNRPTAASSLGYVAPTPVLSIPGLPRALAELCRACMVRRPSERPSAQALAPDLWALIRPLSVPMRLATDPLPKELPATPAAGPGELPAPHPARPATTNNRVPTGYTGRGGRHRRRRPAWSGPSAAHNTV